MTMLTVEVARRLRWRGLSLPVGDDVTYETEELKYIAERQAKLHEEMCSLDVSLYEDVAYGIKGKSDFPLIVNQGKIDIPGES